MDDNSWGKSQTFVELSELALKAVGTWRSFITAVRHYLIGTFAPGDPFRCWDTREVLTHMEVDVHLDNQAILELAAGYESENREDIEENVLLQYVMALEALLSDGKRTQWEKIKRRAALLIGRDDDERLIAEELLRDSYRIRNDLVHGNQVEKSIPPFLNSLRRVCQRTLALTLLLATDGRQKEADFRKMLRSLAVSQESQSIENARGRLFSMIADPGPIDPPREPEG